MKYLFFAVAGWILCQFFLSAPIKEGATRLQSVEQKKRTAASCSPLKDKKFSPSDIPLLPGTGSHQWKISTKVDSAQVYFNQGMNLYYSFHIIEALGSFLKAQQFDPENGMLFWAEALSYGPNINDMGYAASQGVFPAMGKANKFHNGLTPMEIDLIAALGYRYSSDSSAKQDQLNINYRDAMAVLYNKYPNQQEVTALYADALMLIHPWDLYEHDQRPKPWTGELIAVLEKGLKHAPDHPGINHYYIHAVEASATPARAMNSAKKLGSIAPSVSHMVHMPSHIYIRTGNYDEGIKVNEVSLNGYVKYLELYPSVVSNEWLYQFHNIHLLAVCAMMNGRQLKSSSNADELKKAITQDYYSSAPPFRDYIYYMASTPVFSDIRFGKWDRLMSMPEIQDSAAYLKILSEFGRGIALARTKKFEAAEKSLNKMAKLMKTDKDLGLALGAFNSALAGAEVAFAMLSGIIEEEKGNYSRSIEYLKKAVSLEENMIYNEPKDWLLPPLPYLGQVLLKNRNFAEAEQAFQKDLSFNPNNIWSLKGLELTSLAKGNTSAAAKARKELDKVLKGSDLTLKTPVF